MELKIFIYKDKIFANIKNILIVNSPDIPTEFCRALFDLNMSFKKHVI